MTDLKETLDALSEAYIKSSHHTPYAAFIAAYRNGHLIVKPDREVLRERVARALCEANTTQRVQRDAKLTEEERHEIVECQVHNGWDLWLPEANAALTAIFGGGDE